MARTPSWNSTRQLEADHLGCIPLLRVPLRSAATTFVLEARLPSTMLLARALRIWFTEIARVYRVAWHEKERGGVEDKKKKRERGKKGTKEDQRRADRARINCRNTGSSLSTSATHGFSSVGKYVEWASSTSNDSPIAGMRLFPLI